MDTTRPSLLIRIRDPADADAWRQFDAIYRPMIHRYGRCRGLSDADADDLTQHCLSLVIRHIKGFEYDPAKGRFKGWLKTLVNNRVNNIIRKRRPAPFESQDLKRPQARESEPEALFEQVWRQQHLRHCLSELRGEMTDSTFDVFNEYVVNGTPVEKVCRTHKMTANQVYQIRWRVLRKLRVMMQDVQGEDE